MSSSLESPRIASPSWALRDGWRLLILIGLTLAPHRAVAAPAAKATKTAPGPRAAAGVRIDYTPYQQLLNEHLSVISEPGEPLETRFNYEAYHDQSGRDARAEKIRRAFLAVSPSKMDANTRLAWAINFYNYLVLENASQYLLIPDKFRQRYLSVKDIVIEGVHFFDYPFVTVDSVKYTLNEFEKHFLYLDFDHGINTQPPSGLDPRVHFAAVNGSLGAAPLQPRAFKPESLDIQLDRAVRQSLASPKHLILRSDPPAFQISSIFGWYIADFGGAMKVIPWIQRYVSKETSDKLEPYVQRGTFGVIPWDWKINQTLGWRFEQQMKQPAPAPGSAKPGMSKATMRDSI